MPTPLQLFVVNGVGADVTSLFAINSTTGAITVIPARLYDFETAANKTFTLRVRATESDLGLATASSVLGDLIVSLIVSDVVNG